MRGAKMIAVNSAYGRHLEGVADTICKPGMRVALAIDGKYDPVSAEGDDGEILIVKEDALQGKTVEGSYGVGDVLMMHRPAAGDEMMIRLADDQEIVRSQKLMVNGEGKYVPFVPLPEYEVDPEADPEDALDPNPVADFVALDDSYVGETLLWARCIR